MFVQRTCSERLHLSDKMAGFGGGKMASRDGFNFITKRTKNRRGKATRGRSSKKPARTAREDC